MENLPGRLQDQQVRELFKALYTSISKNNIESLENLKLVLNRLHPEDRKKVIDGEYGCLIFATIPLHAHSKNIEMLEYLITECGADIDATVILKDYPTFAYDKDVNLLYIAAMRNEVDFIKVLLKHGKERYTTIQNVIEPIQIAVESGSTEAVKCLIENVMDFSEEVSTFLLQSVGNQEIFNYLISEGLDINYQDPSDCHNTALHCAIKFRSKTVYEKNANMDTVKLLVESGADLSLENSEGFDPVLFAAVKFESGYVEYLSTFETARPESVICAFELIGALAIDYYRDYEKAMALWEMAMHLRFKHKDSPIIKPLVEPKEAFGNIVEPTTMIELNNLDINNHVEMNFQSALIKERIFGKFSETYLESLFLLSEKLKRSKKFKQSVKISEYALGLYLQKHPIHVSSFHHVVSCMFESIEEGISDSSVDVERAYVLFASMIEVLQKFKNEIRNCGEEMEWIMNSGNGTHVYVSKSEDTGEITGELVHSDDHLIIKDTGQLSEKDMMNVENQPGASYKSEKHDSKTIVIDLKRINDIQEMKRDLLEKQSRLFYTSVDNLFYIFILNQGKELNENVKKDLRVYIHLNPRGCDLESLIHIAVKPRNRLSIDRLQYRVSTEVLYRFMSEVIECGASVDASDCMMNAPLHYAMKPITDPQHFQHLQLMQQAGLAVELDPDVGDVVRILIEHGAHLDYCNKDGESPVKKLKEMGIDVFDFQNLQCLSAVKIMQHKIRYKDCVSSHLQNFIERHNNRL